ncbi:hypothetical protein SAMN04487761_1327 [Lachnospiraceae bacterium C7]|nr:hypothetical protein SAMN04487761_1327 [Lachnospiraceae bacterium C7]
MIEKIKGLLKDKCGNYILPFFWQHGEDEEKLREYMEVIDNSNIKAVCVESRPHPDFVGAKWWADMDVILDEARKRNMKVWILDDSHFPTGYSNGAMANQPDEMCRQSILADVKKIAKNDTFIMTKEQLKNAPKRKTTEIEMFAGEKERRHFDDDRLLGVYGVNKAGKLTDFYGAITEDGLNATVNEDMTVYAIYLSRNYGYHTSYINMIQEKSVRVLIDTVYEPHWEHYKDDFGKTIAGFFSDEPELGNGYLYDPNGQMGTKGMDYPWSNELEEAMIEKFGKEFPKKMYLLWDENVNEQEKAEVRFEYMDSLTKLVKKDFSFQIGTWCREHGVKYIGHLIEDNDMHARTGSSLGHYFRGLAGQDYAGIDDIGGQVYPQGEYESYAKGPFDTRNGEFYHFMMGKLASSAAAIEPLKKGNSMCEIFGAYGWQEGVKLEKYLVDHFMVRGINHFVPHAFSAKEFPDPDCPPHFYANGHNPQYRHFGELMKYTNRVLELLNGGKHKGDVAILYHGDSSWSGQAMTSHEVSRIFTENQMNFDFIPQDALINTEEYNTRIEDKKLKINTQEYTKFIVPQCDYLRAGFVKKIIEIAEAGVEVIFVGGRPKGIVETCDFDNESEGIIKKSSEKLITNPTEKLLDDLVKKAKVISLEELEKNAKENCFIEPLNKYIRFYEYTDLAESDKVYMFVNEGTEAYIGLVDLAKETSNGNCEQEKNYYIYDAYNNKIYNGKTRDKKILLDIEPLQSVLIIETDEDLQAQGLVEKSLEDRISDLDVAIQMNSCNEVQKRLVDRGWKRKLTSSKMYPNFEEKTLKEEVQLPDCLEKKMPKWSGIARYETTIQCEKDSNYYMIITDASEGVEVFANGKSLGIQVVPTYRYDLTDYIVDGNNEIAIEVATTLEREAVDFFDPLDEIRGKKEPKSKSGLCGLVMLYSGPQNL